MKCLLPNTYKLFVNVFYTRSCGLNLVLTSKKYFNAHFCSLSRSGFDDYENERRLWNEKIPTKFNFASDVLDKWAQKEKDGERKLYPPAFWYVYENGSELKWSFQDLQTETMKTANFLQLQCKVQRNDNVMVILPKVPEFWLVNIAAIRIGCILSPGSMQLTAKDIEYRLSALKPKCIIVDESVAPTVDSVLGSCEYLKTKVVVSEKEYKDHEWIDFRSRQIQESPSHQCADTESDDSMMIFFTSGTTGHPKMVEHTHSSYGIGQANTGKHWYDATSETILWSLSDTGWAKFAYGSLFAPWYWGSCVFIHQMPRFNPTLTLETLEKFPIDTFCAPPTAYGILAKELRPNHKFPNLSHCLSAGERMNVEVLKYWWETTGLKIFEGYGQTETVLLLGMYKCIEYRPGSIGKPPPGMDVKIFDESEKELGPNEEGEIVLIRDPSQDYGLFKGYKDNPEKTSEQKKPTHFRTGDVGYFDEDGYFWFVGRNDDLINSAGYRIGPFEVESAILEHPAVEEVAVVSSPDITRGEVVKAFIVLKENYQVNDEEELIKELQDFVKKFTAPYKYPRKIEFVKDLPKTTSGKTRRTALRQREWAEEI